MGFPDGSADKESAYSTGDTGNRFDPWVRKIPWSRKMARRVMSLQENK